MRTAAMTSAIAIGMATVTINGPAWAQDGGAGAPDIIVTAERREVSIQKAPLSIAAFDSKDLVQRNVSTPNAIQQIVPAVRFVEIGQQPSLLIRGIGQAVANIYNDPAASFNVDGIAIARPLAINGLFFDLERIEVLKGPQGTLYGRNSTSGAINVLSLRPTDIYEGEINAQLESYDGVRVSGVVNVPIGDTLAVRAGFQVNRHDGYLSNGTNDADSVGGRIKLLWEPSDTFDVVLTATHYKDTGKGVGDVPLKSPTGSFLNPDDPYFVAVGPALNPADRFTRVPDDANQNLQSNTYSANMNLDIGGVTLTVIPAYIKTRYTALTYNGGFRQVIRSTDDQFSVEARLASSGNGPFSWIVGGIFLDDDQTSYNDLTTRPGLRQLQATDAGDLTSYATFAQATYKLTDTLRATGGIRYTHDRKTVRGSFTNVADVPGSPVLSSFPNSGDASFDNVSFRAAIDYDVAPDNLVYANVSTGYKAGGFQPGVAPNTFDPEKITAYTIGTKNRFFDRKVTINLEAWYWDYRNFNVVQFGFVNPLPNFALTTANAPQVESYGVEMQSIFQFTRNDKLTVDLAYVRSRFKEFSSPAFAPTGVPAADYAGQQLNNAPTFSGTVGYTHSFELGSGGRIDASARTRFESRSRLAIQQILGSRISGNRVSDADITFHSADDRFQLGVFVNNIEDKPVLYFAGNTPAGLWGHPRPPRIFGVRGGARF